MDVEESLWSLDEEDDASGQPIKLLMITLVKPPLSEDEIMWKKGLHMPSSIAQHTVTIRQTLVGLHGCELSRLHT